MRIEEGASLKCLNSFGVDARTRRLLVLSQEAELDEALAALAGEQHVLVLGGGTNLLLTGDFAGSVLQVALPGREIVDERGDEVLVEAGAGENWHGFVSWTLAQGLSGLENLSLIPGTVGASPIQNIGAYGVEMREHFESLEAADLQTGRRRRFGTADCRFGYRDSIFKHPEGTGWLILSVRFRLSRHFRPRLDYGDLRAELGVQGVDADAMNGGKVLAERADTRRIDTHRTDAHGIDAHSIVTRSIDAKTVAEAVIAIRRRKLPDPELLGNAGSFFRNPVVERARADALALQYPGMPRYPADAVDAANAVNDGPVKLSAGWLIEQCGWKGYRDGDAGVHDRHALVLVNHGSASGAQLMALAERIRDSVAQRFGLLLEPEPTIVR